MAGLELDIDLLIHGSCFCRGVKFEIDVSEDCSDIYQCHCSICRKRTGSAHASCMIVPADSLRWTEGENLLQTYQPDEGFATVFCSRCGSMLPLDLPEAGKYWVPVGLLDEDPGRPVSSHIFVDSRAPWDVIGDSGSQHPEGFDS